MKQRRDPPALEAETPIASRSLISPFDTTRPERPADATDRDLGLPTRIGPYSILESLGSGGMGEVFLAHDANLDRQVALKRVRTDRGRDEELGHRFEIEARVTAFLQHPAIIPIYHFVNEGDQGTFYTMRPIEGMTLGELIAGLQEGRESIREDWSTARIVRLFLQATNAVGYAHSRGVIHRDLKPSNIMIGPFEEVLVLDWGVATIMSRDSTDTGSAREVSRLESLRLGTDARALIGTPAYMAPERLEDRQADSRTDVFSLGVILYELLALRAPWSATSVPELLDAMRSPPADPSLAQPSREIPAALSEAVLKAISFEREDRFATIADFSIAVAHALEGRAGWRQESESRLHENWRLARGRLRRSQDGIELRSRGNRRSLRYFCTLPFSDNASVELDVRVKGRAGLSVWLNTRLDEHHAIEEGYCLAALPGRRRTLSLRRSGRTVAGAQSPELRHGQWHHVQAVRDGAHLSLLVDGREIYSYGDPIPLTGGFVGITAEGAGIEIRGLQVSTRGTDASVSCLAVPDAFFNRGFFDEARSEYTSIGTSHPGRNEGRVAQFRSGLCEVEMAKRADDPELAALHLDEAAAYFDPRGPLPESCLVALGRAHVARERGDLETLHSALASALADFPDDPHLETAGEWTLGQLHSLEADQRLLLAVFLPLAIRYGRAGWGAGLVHGLVRQVRGSWETPSFMSGRGRYRSGDPASRAESEIFFAFWSGRPAWIVHVAHELLTGVSARPHHLSDAIWCLLELNDASRARELLEIASELDEGSSRERRRHLTLARSALLAVEGELEAASELLAELTPSPDNRAFNSARLWIARSTWAAGKAPLETLRRMGAKDYFGREQRAWYALLQGDLTLAGKELRPMVERNDHRAGRNMVNLLYGALQLSQGQVRRAHAIFRHLTPKRWPRSWTLGSHLAAGTLGDGDVGRYLGSAFAWERRVLESHRELLDAVGYEPL